MKKTACTTAVAPVLLGPVLMAAVLFAAVLFATGCGTASHRDAAGGSGSQVRTLAADQGPVTLTRQQGDALARTLLAEAPLPPGAQVFTGKPPAALGQPPMGGLGDPSAELHALWTVSEPMSAVDAFWGRSEPAGMTSNGSGQNTSYGAVTQEFVGYQLDRMPTGVNVATLSMTVTPAGPDASAIRADVQVIWYPPRSAAEYIPASLSAVTITTSTLDGQGGGTQTFTAPAVVQRLEAMLNGAYAVPLGSVFPCPLEQVSYRLDFATAPGAAPSVVVTDTGCPGLGITVAGHAEPSLEIPAALQPFLAGLTHVAPGDLTHGGLAHAGPPNMAG
jgi:hypothetical protein